MLSDYLNDKFIGSTVAKIIASFQNTNPRYRMVLRVPARFADNVTLFLRRAIKPEYRFFRRAGGGPRRDPQQLTCKVADATYFKFYIERKH